MQELIYYECLIIIISFIIIVIGLIINIEPTKKLDDRR